MSHDSSEIILKPAVNFIKRLMVLGLQQKGEKVPVDEDLICCVKNHLEGFVVVCIAGEDLHLWQKSRMK